MVKSNLPNFDITEIGLRNGAIEDCSGCPYTMCLHFGEKGGCFYGGVIVKEVYPALQRCNGIVILAPNYNDSVSANITAFINRLTSVYRQAGFFDKALFGIVVSGYSGGDIVASQLLSGFCMNKSFIAPANAFLMETANSPKEINQVNSIEKRAKDFADNIANFFI